MARADGNRAEFERIQTDPLPAISLPSPASCHTVAWRSGWQGKAVASIRADDVFWRIEWIAHSIESLEDRRGRTEARIDVFLADLAEANLPPGLADTIAG